MCVRFWERSRFPVLISAYVLWPTYHFLFCIESVGEREGEKWTLKKTVGL